MRPQKAWPAALLGADGPGNLDRIERRIKTEGTQTEAVLPPFREAPHNIEAEQALLGAMLINNEAHDRVSSFLRTEHFFDPVHARIYEVAATLIGSGKQATPITLRTFFETAEPIAPGLSVPQYLGRLAAHAATIINAADYGRTIYDLAIRRQLILVGEDLAANAAEAAIDLPPHALVHAAMGELAAIGEEAHYDGWPDPDMSLVRRAEGLVPAMPLGGLGLSLAQYVEAAAEALGAPQDYVGLALLVGAAGTIGARRYVEIWDGWPEPGILWGALVGDPSSNKSPAIDPIREALNAAEGHYLSAYEAAEQDYAVAVATARSPANPGSGPSTMR